MSASIVSNYPSRTNVEAILACVRMNLIYPRVGRLPRVFHLTVVSSQSIFFIKNNFAENSCMNSYG